LWAPPPPHLCLPFLEHSTLESPPKKTYNHCTHASATAQTPLPSSSRSTSFILNVFSSPQSPNAAEVLSRASICHCAFYPSHPLPYLFPSPFPPLISTIPRRFRSAAPFPFTPLCFDSWRRPLLCQTAPIVFLFFSSIRTVPSSFR